MRTEYHQPADKPSSLCCFAEQEENGLLSNEYRIKKKILRSYDKTSRPVRDDATAVNVLIAVTLNHILDTVCAKITTNISYCEENFLPA